MNFQQQRLTPTIAIGAASTNILSGTQYEYVDRPSKVTLYMCSNTGDQAFEFGVGADRPIPSSIVPLRAAGAGPLTNEDWVGDAIAQPGRRLQLNVAGGAAAETVRVIIRITPLA